MGKNNRPGVEALRNATDPNATDPDDALLNTMAEDGDEAGNDFLEDWKPPSLLEAPPPRPGFVQHWCRMSSGGRADASQRLYNEQQGWRPRRVDTIPEADREKYAVGKDAQHGDVITQGALVLCEMPQRKADQRNAYYRRKHDRQMGTMVTNQIAETNQMASAGFGPIKMSRESKTTTGRKNIAQAD